MASLNNSEWPALIALFDELSAQEPVSVDTSLDVKSGISTVAAYGNDELITAKVRAAATRGSYAATGDNSWKAWIGLLRKENLLGDVSRVTGDRPVLGAGEASSEWVRIPHLARNSTALCHVLYSRALAGLAVAESPCSELALLTQSERISAVELAHTFFELLSFSQLTEVWDKIESERLQEGQHAELAADLYGLAASLAWKLMPNGRKRSATLKQLEESIIVWSWSFLVCQHFAAPPLTFKQFSARVRRKTKKQIPLITSLAVGQSCDDPVLASCWQAVTSYLKDLLPVAPVTNGQEQSDELVEKQSPQNDDGRVLSANDYLFRKEGQFWTVAFGGETIRMKDSKGMLYLSYLLSCPGRDLKAVELVAASEAGKALPQRSSAGEAIDRTARSDYEARATVVADQIGEARRNNDFGRVELLQGELDALADQISMATGLGGRSRIVGDTNEKARKAVGQAVSRAIANMKPAHPSLAKHLNKSISRGASLSYSGPAAWTS